MNRFNFVISKKKKKKKTDTDFYLVYDYIEGGDLFTRLSDGGMIPFSENRVRKIAKQLVDILLRIHERGISHRDIKLENIMISNSEKSVYLIDFGLSFHYDNYDACNDHSGTREYAPPEIISGQKSFSSTASDIWSLGVTIFTLLYGTFPFNYDKKETEAKRIGYYPYPYFSPKAGRSKEAIDFLRNMLEADPSQRITLKELVDHPFLLKKHKLFRNYVIPTNQ
eukprot:TRINITY_DN579_c0_g2_i3.p1 TRINITY_DN579_c0_g2~~TRINITY_DN579_c0_g2_i3.p1  ORF type:complete len:224 (+),score=37.83 TRINITY_DN579_c0_g2_i3:1507-2178(+)